MLRFILILAILIALISLIRGIIRTTKLKISQSKTAELSKMVRCEYCELYISIDEAIKANDKYYCSLQHQSLQVDKKC